MNATTTMLQQTAMVNAMVERNIDGVTHEQSLIQPQPAGNCINWVLGHLLAIYAKVLPMLGQEPVLSMDVLHRYDRGSAPITDPGDALPFERLASAWKETSKRIDAGIEALDAGRLDDRVAESPTNNPDETVHSLLMTVTFHQTYHSGQLGVLRRIAGLPGAIK